MKKIEDKYTDLKVSRQRKHQLRYPERNKEMGKRYRATEAGRQSNLEASRRAHLKNPGYQVEYEKKHRAHHNEWRKQYRIRRLLNEI